MIFFCETADGDEGDFESYCASAAAELFAEDRVNGGHWPIDDRMHVRVTAEDGTRSFFDVSVEMIPDAEAKSCDGAGLGFDDEAAP